MEKRSVMLKVIVKQKGIGKERLMEKQMVMQMG